MSSFASLGLLLLRCFGVLLVVSLPLRCHLGAAQCGRRAGSRGSSFHTAGSSFASVLVHHDILIVARVVLVANIATSSFSASGSHPAGESEILIFSFYHIIFVFKHLYFFFLFMMFLIFFRYLSQTWVVIKSSWFFAWPVALRI